MEKQEKEEKSSHFKINILSSILNKEHIPVLCIFGPTGIGKTCLAIELSKNIPSTLISVDSIMVYKGLNIGSAKPKGIEHKLIDVCNPIDEADTYSAGRFYKDATIEIEDSINKKRIPILVGGTMMYFYILLNGIHDVQSNIPISKRLEEFDTDTLYAKLMSIDKEYAEIIQNQRNNRKRICRILETYEITGCIPSRIHERNTSNMYRYIIFSLLPHDRDILNKKIESRFNNMIENGLVDETRNIFYGKIDAKSNISSLNSVGYKQVWQYINGKIDIEEMRYRSIVATRQLIKKQMTWIRNWKYGSIFTLYDKDDMYINTRTILEKI